MPKLDTIVPLVFLLFSLQNVADGDVIRELKQFEWIGKFFFTLFYFFTYFIRGLKILREKRAEMSI